MPRSRIFLHTYFSLKLSGIRSFGSLIGSWRQENFEENYGIAKVVAATTLHDWYIFTLSLRDCFTISIYHHSKAGYRELIFYDDKSRLPIPRCSSFQHGAFLRLLIIATDCALEVLYVRYWTVGPSGIVSLTALFGARLLFYKSISLFRLDRSQNWIS